MEAAEKFRNAMWGIWPRPPSTLIPIAPARFDEKKASGDFFYSTVLREGVLIAEKN